MSGAAPTATLPRPAALRSIYPDGVTIGSTQRPGGYRVDVRIEADSVEDLERAVDIYRDQWRVYDPTISAAHATLLPNGRWQAIGARSDIGD
ncbi:MAG: hypothetical protein ING19_21120 [Azospirillum sp.]|nr:hypothetical protein [Azospirillum sp.]MCA3268554.1 hypothetical protein [Azospirillum sp.]